MKSKWLIYLFVLFFCLSVVFSFAQRDFAVASTNGSEKIETSLLDQIASQGSADFIVRFIGQADLSSAYSMDWVSRGEFVYRTLEQASEQSQVYAKQELDAQGLTYQTFLAGNELYVWGDGDGTTGVEQADIELAVINSLAAMPEVSSIRATHSYSIDPIDETIPLEHITWAGELLANHAPTSVENSINAAIDWGITDSKADQFWSTFGVQGAGITVANIDTGVQWDHPGLHQSFKCGANPGDPSCWAEPVPLGGTTICSGLPCDNQGHGTHTMGTMVGDNDASLPYIVGMAPDAKWIACKGCENNQCSDFALNACADWILAPGGNPANRPNIVNNSWGGDVGGDAFFNAKVQAWRAAGIFPAFSAGNNGSSGCSSLSSPGDYQESFASAAHDSSRNIGSFSSRGPSFFGDVPYTKPNLSSPGVSINSTIPGSGYGLMTGTSMASPHTAGAVALLWSCNPAYLGKIDETFQVLQNNTDLAPAGSCGAPAGGSGNYTYGYGYLDVLKAGQAMCIANNSGSIHGFVRDQDHNPLTEASVDATLVNTGSQFHAVTDPTGYYTMTLPAGTYNLIASKTNYLPKSATGIIVTANTATSLDFTLNAQRTWKKIALPQGCPDWTRFDGIYFPPTGLVYFLGGRSGALPSTVVGTIYSYNPNTNMCAETGIDMLTPVSNYTLIQLNNGSADLLCMFGGLTGASTYTDMVQCYNPIDNTVSSVSTLPGDLAAYIPGGAAAVNNIAYVFGGFRSNTSPYQTSQTWAYNPVSNTWIQKGNLSTSRGYIDVAVVDGIIYGFGGETYNGTTLTALSIAESFDPKTGTWSDAAVRDLPTTTGEGRAIGFDHTSGYVLAGKVVIAGGYLAPDQTNRVLTYNISSNTYDSGFVDLNVARRDFAGFFVPGAPAKMWVFGGRSTAIDDPPFAPPEYYQVDPLQSVYLPLLRK